MSSHCVSVLIKIMCGTRFTFQFTKTTSKLWKSLRQKAESKRERERKTHRIEIAAEVMKNWRHTALNANTSRRKTNSIILHFIQSYTLKLIIQDETVQFLPFLFLFPPLSLSHSLTAAKTNSTATRATVLLNPADNRIAYL